MNSHVIQLCIKSMKFIPLNIFLYKSLGSTIVLSIYKGKVDFQEIISKLNLVIETFSPNN